MSPALTTFLFQIVNFLLLLSLVSWLLFKPVRASLDARRAAEQQRQDTLAVQVADVQKRADELATRTRALDTEMAHLREAHVAAAAEEAESIRREAHEAAERERLAAQRAIGQLEQAQLDTLATAIADVCGQTLARMLNAIGPPEIEASLVRAAAGRLATLTGAPLGPVLVESASPLTDDVKKRIEESVGGPTTPIEFRIDDELGAGVRVVTSRGLIDATTRGIARDATQLLADALARPESRTAA